MSSVSDVREMRGEILRLNAELRVLQHLALDGNVSLRDMLVLTRLFSGGQPELANLIANIQVLIAVLQTARITLKALQLEMGPIGWAMLAIGVGGTLILGQQFRSRQP